MTRPLVVRAGGRELDGVVRDGESWLAAARRTCATVSGEPVPVDLSGDPLVFAIDQTRVEVRAMTRDDLPIIVAWRADPVVARWWSGDVCTPDQLTQLYGERIDGLTPTRMWLVEIDGHPAGFTQDHRLADVADPAGAAGAARHVSDPAAIGVDYALGDPQWRGRGLGVRMLWAWALRARRRFPDATAYVAAPHEHHAASLRVLAKAGFTAGATFEEPRRDGGTDVVRGCTLDVTTVLGPPGAW